MSKTKDKDLNKRKPRKGVYLSDIAIKEITEVLSHYNTEQKIELIEHLQQMFKEVTEYFKTNSENIYKNYAERQQELLKKYGKLFKPFANKRFDNYFDFKRILSIKDYYTAEEYNQLESNDDLTEQDIYELTTSMRNFLNGELHFLYLDREPQFPTNENESKEDVETLDRYDTKRFSKPNDAITAIPAPTKPCSQADVASQEPSERAENSNNAGSPRNTPPTSNTYSCISKS